MRSVSAILLLGLLAPLSAGADVFTVTKTDDTLDGACGHDCSLREAVTAANQRPGLDIVLVGPGIYTLTREGRAEDAAATGDLDISDALALFGAGADRTVLDGGGIDRVLEVRAAGRLEIQGVTVRNGSAQIVRSPHGNVLFDWGHGGGIASISVPPLAVRGVHITGNRAETDGGGLSAYSLDLRESTVSGNQAGGYAGGIALASEGVMADFTVSGNRAGEVAGGIWIAPAGQEIRGATITGNSAPVGGGIFAERFTCPSLGLCRTDVVLTRSVVAGNSASRDVDCSGLPFDTRNGHNVFGVREGCPFGSSDRGGTPAAPLDPGLAPLGHHGGPTPTHALLPASPALDFAGSCEGADQRGRSRPADGDGDGAALCDAGAVELAPGCQPGGEALCLGAGGRFQVTVRWTALGTSGAGQALPLAADTGAFWFFAPENLELTLKVLDGCGVNGRFWVFASGLTDVEVEITVTDTATGVVWSHVHTPGTPFQPWLDTAAFDTCS